MLRTLKRTLILAASQCLSCLGLSIDNFARRFPVSAKGILIRDNSVLLVKNERQEWELPGGKLGSSESLIDCVSREFLEETGIAIEVGDLVTVWQYQVARNSRVIVVAYRCKAVGDCVPRVSPEHSQICFLPLSEFSSQEIEANTRAAIIQAARYSLG